MISGKQRGKDIQTINQTGAPYDPCHYDTALKQHMIQVQKEK
jgi:hypothetical protein